MKARLAFLLLSAIISVAWVGYSQPPMLVVKVSGVSGPLYARLTVRSGNRSATFACTVVNGTCELPVESTEVEIIGIEFGGRIVPLRVRGSNEALWGAGRWGEEIRYVLREGGVMAYMRVVPEINGSTLTVYVEAGRACTLVLQRRSPIGDSFEIPRWDRWRIVQASDDEQYTIVMPYGFSFGLPLRTPIAADVSQEISGLGRYGLLATRQGEAIWPCEIGCQAGNASLASLVARELRGRVGETMDRERRSLSTIGISVEQYLEGFEYSLSLLDESEGEFAKGDFEVGSALFKRALIKAYQSVEDLNMLRTESVGVFIALMLFTFFISTVISALSDARRKDLITLGAFGALALVEIIALPQPKVALSLFLPQNISKISPTAIATSIITIIVPLSVVMVLAASARGTVLSDIFWYSVRSMRRRRMRSALTLFTIAVVTASSIYFVSVGFLTKINVEEYEAGFEGVSVSLHTTTITYVYRGPAEVSDVTASERLEPLSAAEARWLSRMDWVRGIGLVASGRAVVERSGRRVWAKLVVSNATGISNGVALSRSIANFLGVGRGDVVVINGTESTVVSIFEAPLTAVDGLPVASGDEWAVVAGLRSIPEGFHIDRLILIGDSDPAILDLLLKLSFEKEVHSEPGPGGTVTTYVYKSYRACRGDGEKTVCKYVYGELPGVSGTPEYLLIVILASLTITTTMLSSVYERRREYSIISSLGASPHYIVSFLMVEGMSYGLVGGCVGYVIGQVLAAFNPLPAAPVSPQSFSPAFTSLALGLVPSIIGAIFPARRAVLEVVPSRLMVRRGGDIVVEENRAEAEIPLRISRSDDLFPKYILSLTARPVPLTQGPIYKWVKVYEAERGIERIELLVNYREDRYAEYLVTLILPGDPGETMRAVAISAEGGWGPGHKSCARSMLQSLREDILHYVEWKKKMG